MSRPFLHHLNDSFKKVTDVTFVQIFYSEDLLLVLQIEKNVYNNKTGNITT